MTELAARVPCTVVTGFLGAGKTTLIRHLLENAGGRRLAILVNEFGEVGIDGEILKGCGIESCPEENIVELANGCICCTVADDFVPALDLILSREPRVDHILIETSGLALPKPLVQAFQWPGVKSRVTVDSVVAVVDGPALAEGRVAQDEEALAAQRAADPSLDHDDPVEEVFGDQVACADLVVLTKGDLLDDGGAGAARGAGRAAPRAGGEGGAGRARPGRSGGAARAGAGGRGRDRRPADAARRRARARPRRLRELRGRAAARWRGRRSWRRGSPRRRRRRTCCGSRASPRSRAADAAAGAGGGAAGQPPLRPRLGGRRAARARGWW